MLMTPDQCKAALPSEVGFWQRIIDGVYRESNPIEVAARARTEPDRIHAELLLLARLTGGLIKVRLRSTARADLVAQSAPVPATLGGHS
jgi:hypothetical protein